MLTHAIDIVIANYDYEGGTDELSGSRLPLKQGDTIYVLDKKESGWWDGVKISQEGKSVVRGWFPYTYTIPKYNYYSRKVSTSSGESYNTIGAVRNSISSGGGGGGGSTSTTNPATTNGDDDDDDKHPVHKNSNSNSNPINILTVEEIEMLINTLHSPSFASQPQTPARLMWTPIYTDNNKLLYYNSKLNIYCASLPLLYHSEASLLSVVPSNTAFPQSKSLPLGIKDSSPQENNDTAMPPLLSSTIVQPILSEENLFYYHSYDIHTWDQLLSATRQTIKLTQSSLHSGSSSEYNRYYHLLTTYFTYITMACHLYLKPKTTNFVRLLKRNISSLSTISLSSVCDTSADLDSEFSKLEANLIAISKMVLEFEKTTKDLSKLLLPQIFPRFFKDSFNGGCWTNPFHTYNYSQNDESNGLPLPMSKALQKASQNTSNLLSKYSFLSADSSYYNLKRLPQYNTSATRSRYSSYNTRSRGSKNSNNTSSSSDPTTLDFTDASSCSSGMHNKTVFPLNNETLKLLRKRVEQIIEKIYGNEGEHIEVLKEPKTKKRDLEINSKVYDEFNSNTSMLEIIEHLNLSVFVNLTKLIKRMDSKDGENKSPSEFSSVDETLQFPIDDNDQEFLRHFLSSITHLLTDFFDLKQSLHDTVMRLIMGVQHATLEDPYIFSSMRPVLQTGFAEMSLNSTLDKPILTRDKSSCGACSLKKQEDHDSWNLYRTLVEQDVETNTLEFLDCAERVRETCGRYAELAEITYGLVEQLVEERENLLNYAARTMKSELIAILMRDEQMQWIEPTTSNVSSAKDGNQEALDDQRQKQQQPSYANDFWRDQNIPWYLKSDYVSKLVFNSSGAVKGGTKEALIEHLTTHEAVDPSFNVVMLFTFRSMFTLKEFLYALVSRYRIAPPQGLSYDEFTLWIEKKSYPIKCNVIGIMKSLFQQYWNPAYFDPALSVFLPFVEIAVNEGIIGSKELYDDIREIIEANGAPLHYQLPSNPIATEFGKNNNMNIVNPSSSRTSSMSNISASSRSESLLLSKLLGIGSYLYATQLTLREQELFMGITVYECMDRVWGSKNAGMGGSVHIGNFISNANNLTNFVSHSIVTELDPNRRAELIQFFVSVADQCKKFHNFSSMTAIISALYSSPVFRLRKTWDLVDTETTNVLRALNELMNTSKNFSNYRESVKSLRNASCIPFFGVFLSDLTFTATGNPDYLDSSREIINFSKRTKIVEILKNIMSFKQLHYKFKRSDDVQRFIEDSLTNVPHIEKQYELSLSVEPRNNTSSIRREGAKPITMQEPEPSGTGDGSTVNKGGFLRKSKKNKQSFKLFS